jgi:hypothetical protein
MNTSLDLYLHTGRWHWHGNGSIAQHGRVPSCIPVAVDCPPQAAYGASRVVHVPAHWESRCSHLRHALASAVHTIQMAAVLTGDNLPGCLDMASPRRSDPVGVVGAADGVVGAAVGRAGAEDGVVGAALGRVGAAGAALGSCQLSWHDIPKPSAVGCARPPGSGPCPLH